MTPSNPTCRTVLLCALTFAAAPALFSTCAQAQVAAIDLNRRVDFNIAAQPLPSALMEFSAQTGLDLSASTDLVEGKKGGLLKGNYATGEALSVLLRGTGLIFTATDSGVAIIATSAGESKNKKVSTPESPASVRLAQVENSQLVQANMESSIINSEARLEEILVTAQKREERLQDVPVSVTALNADELVQRNELSLRDYITKIPGLTLTEGFGGMTQAVVLRGLNSGDNPTVAFTIDDIPYGTNTSYVSTILVPDLDPGDLSSVEVLRGPQGTLYGASSLGGLIKYTTLDPSTDGLTGHLSAGTTSVTNGDKLGYSLRGRINLPVTGNIATALSGFTRTEPGYIDNDGIGEKGANEQRVSGGQWTGLWRPSENWSLKLSALYQDHQTDGTNEVNVGLGEFQQNLSRGTNTFGKKFGVYSAVLKGSIGDAELTSATGFSTIRISNIIDLGFLAGFFGNDSSGNPVTGTANVQDYALDRFSQELRLDAPLGDGVDARIGALYTSAELNGAYSIIPWGKFTGTPIDNGYYWDGTRDVELTERALFGSLTFHVTDRFDLQVGGRQSWIEQSDESEDERTVFGGSLGFPLITPPSPIDDDQPRFDYSITPSFKVSPDVMIYARAASGYRIGGPNTAICVSEGFPCRFKPDFTQNFELGTKAGFFDRKLFLDLSVYYIPWKDIQLSTDSENFFSYVSNGGDARSQGVELTFESRPFAGLTISGWMAWNDAELTEDTPVNSQIDAQKGDQLPFSAEWSGRLAVRKDFPLLSQWQGFVEGSGNYMGERTGNFGTRGQDNYPSYTKYDFSAGVRMNSSGWSANMVVTNVTDKRGSQTGNPLNGTVIYIQPRTIGVQLGYNFE